MEKTISILILLVTMALPAYGQENKNVVYKVMTGDFAYTVGEKKNSVGNVLGAIAEAMVTGKSSQQQAQYADVVRASVVSGLSNVMRFRTTEGDYILHRPAPDEPAFYADGTITNISTVTKTEPSTKKGAPANQYYRCLISVTVNLKDAHDDTVENSHTFTITDSDMSWLGSTDKAVNDALERLTRKVTDYYNGLFPLYASIIEAGEVKKDKQKEVYIDLGAVNGAYQGMQFNVYLVKTVAGRESRSEIGRLKIEEVQGDDLSLCKVTRGGDKIKDALQNDSSLVVITR